MGFRAWGRGLAAGAAAWAALAALPASAARNDWPHTLPAQPLVQAADRCAPGVVALNRRCHVYDFAELGESPDGRAWYYAFYGTRWADRHGRMERGFPVVFYRQGPATLRLSLWVNDEPGLAGRWSRTPPPRPVLIERPEGEYLGLTLKSVSGPDSQRLFRRNKLHWKGVDILHRSDQDQARLDAITPRGCEAADDGFYDWAGFRLVLALRQSLTHAPCGVILGELAVDDTKLSLTSAVYDKTVPVERPAQPAPSAASAPLTPPPGGHNSQPR